MATSKSPWNVDCFSGLFNHLHMKRSMKQGTAAETIDRLAMAISALHCQLLLQAALLFFTLSLSLAPLCRLLFSHCCPCGRDTLNIVRLSIVGRNNECGVCERERELPTWTCMPQQGLVWVAHSVLDTNTHNPAHGNSHKNSTLHANESTSTTSSPSLLKQLANWHQTEQCILSKTSVQWLEPLVWQT